VDVSLIQQVDKPDMNDLYHPPAALQGAQPLTVKKKKKHVRVRIVCGNQRGRERCGYNTALDLDIAINKEADNAVEHAADRIQRTQP
jgi:ribosomal protein S5